MNKPEYFFLYDVPNHDEIKDKLLLYFDELTEKHNLGQNPSRNISSTDYFHLKGSPPYKPIILDNLVPIIIDKLLPVFYCKGIEFQGCWFQQYNKGSDFSYHNHPGSHFAGIYYIELPDSPTEFLGFDSPTINEGQLLVFPSYLVHKSPVNNSDERKTVVAFNFSITFKEH